jgi:hypothetical protein
MVVHALLDAPASMLPDIKGEVHRTVLANAIAWYKNGVDECDPPLWRRLLDRLHPSMYQNPRPPGYIADSDDHVVRMVLRGMYLGTPHPQRIFCIWSDLMDLALTDGSGLDLTAGIQWLQHDGVRGGVWWGGLLALDWKIARYPENCNVGFNAGLVKARAQFAAALDRIGTYRREQLPTIRSATSAILIPELQSLVALYTRVIIVSDDALVH